MTYRCASSNPQYSITAANVSMYKKNILQLASVILFWPDPLELEKLASKAVLISHLDEVARTCTQSFRPTTERLSPGQSIPSNTVLKRTNSDCGLHVLMPESIHRNWEYLHKNSEIDGSIWLSQSYVPSLYKLGEWRVILIGGQVVHTVHTHYKPHLNDWTFNAAEKFYSLGELRYEPVFVFVHDVGLIISLIIVKKLLRVNCLTSRTYTVQITVMLTCSNWLVRSFSLLFRKHIRDSAG